MARNSTWLSWRTKSLRQNGFAAGIEVKIFKNPAQMWENWMIIFTINFIHFTFVTTSLILLPNQILSNITLYLFNDILSLVFFFHFVFPYHSPPSHPSLHSPVLSHSLSRQGHKLLRETETEKERENSLKQPSPPVFPPSPPRSLHLCSQRYRSARSLHPCQAWTALGTSR